MFANHTNYKARLTVAPQQALVEVPRASAFPLPGEADFPSPPAIPSALLRLDLWLSEFVTDLQDITNIVRSDIGLTVQILRLAAREIEKSPRKIVPISEIVVDLGVEKLRTLVAGTRTLPDRISNHVGASVCERFWAHSRLTALVAEELADQYSNVTAEEAYLAGLLCHLGDLPSLLGWATMSSDARDPHQAGRRMAQSWGFPCDLVDVIGGDPAACRTRESRALLDIVTDAGIWASRLEFLAARESELVRVKSPPYRRGRG
jgi:HD-like signal output (HDOD) protein